MEKCFYKNRRDLSKAFSSFRFGDGCLLRASRAPGEAYILILGGIMPVLSVVIPVYNMCEWLAPTLESCLWQTHKNIEIILIDDGSRDNSLEIAEAYSRLDSRIRVISRPNAGAGAARQHGQDEASGDFITWLDADDLLDKNAASVWMGAAVRDGADLVCGNAVAFSSRTFNARRYFHHKKASGLRFDTAPRYWKSKVLWRWAFSLPLLRRHGLSHSGYKLGQDVCFMFEALLRAGSFSQADPCVYYFRQEHKSAYPSLEVLVNHGFAHYTEARRILLRDTPDGKPRIKPFVKYLNENYWRDIRKAAPRLAGDGAPYESRVIELGFELFDGLDPQWFTKESLAPEVKEAPAFLPLVRAMVDKDEKIIREIINSLRETAAPAPDKKNRFHTVRHTVKSLMNPLAYKARLCLARLESRAAKRRGLPRPEPVRLREAR